MNLTDHQLHILRHPIGLDDLGLGREYRSHFATTPDCDDWIDCQFLAQQGLMVSGGKIAAWGFMETFQVTEEGRRLARVVVPKLSRSQERYQQFLRSDCGEGFGQWLRWQKFRGVA